MTTYCGVDFHVRQQTVYYCDTADSVIHCQELRPERDDVRGFYAQFNGEVIVGLEASELAEQILPHCTLMDLNLPVLDGFMATQRLLSNPGTSHIPVIAISGHCWDYDWEPRALSVGCEECVRKPIDFDALNEVIRKHVRTGGGRSDFDANVKKLQLYCPSPFIQKINSKVTLSF